MMRIRAKCLFLSLLILQTRPDPAGAQEAKETTSLPETVATERVLDLVAAVGSGSRAELRAFLERSYAPGYSGFGSVEDLASYWAAVRDEVGPLTVEVFSTIPIADTEIDVYWARGTVTRFWVGLELQLEPGEPHRIVRHAVLRGTRPRLGPRADPGGVGVRPLDPARLSSYLDGWLSDLEAADHFSGAVAIMHGSDLVYERGVGLADRDLGRRVSSSTPLRLASVTKMFTGVAIAQLEERGLLSYDDPLSRFVPEYPRHIADRVTVRHLLTHTSGIELDDDPDYNRAAREASSIGDLLQAQLTYIDRLNRGNYESFEPLSEFDYTNEGIDLLGVIVERAGGLAWDEYLREHVFAPAGMTSTGAVLLAPPDSLAVAYTRRSMEGGWLPDGPVGVPDRSIFGSGRVRPAGSGWSTAGDMARFVRAFRDGTLVGADSYRVMTSPQISVGSRPGEELSYGYALNVETRSGTRVIGHRGGAPGTSTDVFWYPDLDWTVVVLSNLDRAGDHVFWHIEELLGVR